MAAKTKAELQAENRILRRSHGAQATAAVIQTLIRYSGLVAIAYFAYRSVEALSGQTTLADVGIRFLADVQVSESLAWIAALCGGGYGWRQRKLRKDTIERMSGRMTSLETSVDSKRTSSRLTARGDTHPGDRI